MHSKSENTEILIYDKADEAIQELFESLLSRYILEELRFVILSLIAVIYCLTNVTKNLQNFKICKEYQKLYLI